MILSRLNLMYFKNYEEASFTFSSGINCLVGPNGVGKTNLLDAIHYLSMTRSAFNTIDQQNILHGESFFMLHGQIKKQDDQYGVQCNVQAGKKKLLTVNKESYQAIGEHIGRFPTVLIAPDDTELVREGSETRRKFFDSMIAQTDQAYLNGLLQYQRALRHRNSLLKQFAESRQLNKTLLEPYDRLLVKHGRELAQKRSVFLADFSHVFQAQYQQLTDQKETVGLNYQTQADQPDFAEKLREALPRDLQRQFTTFGIHKDDYVFTIGGHPLKKFGSQGQQKSFVVALKLAQYAVVKRLTSTSPLLLLDDIFDKLDDRRIGRLLQMVTDHQFGQIFLSDARPERSRNLLANIGCEVEFFDIGKAGAARIAQDGG